MVEYKDRLQQAMKDRGVSVTQLADALDTSYQAVKKVVDGKSNAFTAPNNTRAAAFLGVSSDWLAVGKPYAKTAGESITVPALAWPFESVPENQVRDLPLGDLKALEGALALAIAQLKIGVTIAPPAEVKAPPPPRQGTVVDTSTVEDPFPFIPSKPMPWEIPPVDSPRPHREDLRINTAVNVGRVTDTGYSANDQEYLPVPELSVRLAAGQLGIENYSETEIGEIMFRRSFLASLGLPIERMKIVYADGDSMAPVIRDKAPMLFYEELISDPSQIDTRTVYAINYGGKMIVKCLVRNRFNKWMARSLNPAHKDFPLAEDDGSEVRIVGRILWSPYDLRDGVDERLVRR